MWPFKPTLIWHLPQNRKELLPTKGTPDAMAYDLKSPGAQTIPARSSILVNTLVAVTIPKGYAIIFGSRSGMAANSMVTVEAGWIDSDYRGLLKVLLYNHSDNPVEILAGQRVAQAMLVKTHAIKEETCFAYPDTNATKRGAGGFGSTGK